MLTFAEFLLFVCALALLTYLMKPLQQFLEPRLRKFFKSKVKPNQSPVIDITDYSKRKKKD